MKDGEIWVVEKKVKGRWRFVQHFYIKPYAEASCDNHIAYECNPNYRVVKYIRQENDAFKAA